MSNNINHIVIVGGGTAGWLTAGILAAERLIKDAPYSIKISLIESTEIAPIGVGEGTWPSMRETLKTIGIDEGEFLTQCDASFKQGSKFINWTHNTNDFYYHPFSLPEQYHQLNLAEHWLPHREQVSFTDAVTFQGQLCEKGLAPKQISTPAYSFFGNYGYHLDAGKFGPFLREHCVNKLGIRHIDDKVVEVRQDEHGYIQSVFTEKHGEIEGDLFVDCTGLHGLLLDKVYKIPFVDRNDVLFNDRAIAVQVPYHKEDDPIQSATVSTAQQNGWTWDIGLQSRRGVGMVYSSAHSNEENELKTLKSYLAKSHNEKQIEQFSFRTISIRPGHREKFWHKNVLAVGMAAGFIEPLEASAIALIEQSAKYLAKQLPKNRDTMNIIAKRFNRKFLERWDQVLDFLKLHYVLSERRDSQYWLDNTHTSTIPEPLADKLLLWQTQCPYTYDSFATEELFPSASYQFVYYGMGGQTELIKTSKWLSQQRQAHEQFDANQKKTSQIINALSSNRALLEKISQYGLQKI